MDKKETQHIARLARLRFNDDELNHISEEMTGILKWVDMLQTVDTSSTENLIEDITPLRTRKDEVKIANLSESLIKNATEPYEHFFTVPKVVE